MVIDNNIENLIPIINRYGVKYKQLTFIESSVANLKFVDTIDKRHPSNKIRSVHLII